MTTENNKAYTLIRAQVVINKAIYCLCRHMNDVFSRPESTLDCQLYIKSLEADTTMYEADDMPLIAGIDHGVIESTVTLSVLAETAQGNSLCESFTLALYPEEKPYKNETAAAKALSDQVKEMLDRLNAEDFKDESGALPETFTALSEVVKQERADKIQKGKEEKEAKKAAEAEVTSELTETIKEINKPLPVAPVFESDIDLLERKKGQAQEKLTRAAQAVADLEFEQVGDVLKIKKNDVWQDANPLEKLKYKRVFDCRNLLAACEIELEAAEALKLATEEVNDANSIVINTELELQKIESEAEAVLLENNRQSATGLSFSDLEEQADFTEVAELSTDSSLAVQEVEEAANTEEVTNAAA